MSKQEIYNCLRAGGLSEAGALGMMGNWDCESNLEPGRLQGDFSPFRTTSKSYVQRATSGQMTKDEFCKAIGFGLAQWTFPQRKAALWDAWKKSGLALDSAELQVDFALIELKSGYSGLLEFLKTTKDLYLACSRICKEFERPAVNNVDARFASANKLKYELDLDGRQEEEAEPEPEPAKETYWPPRMLCDGMSGPDVEVLQAILKARGYIVTNPDGIFGSYLEQKVTEFQEVHGLAPDGICGPLTWGELLKR